MEVRLPVARRKRTALASKWEAEEKSIARKNGQWSRNAFEAARRSIDGRRTFEDKKATRCFAGEWRFLRRASMRIARSLSLIVWFCLFTAGLAISQ